MRVKLDWTWMLMAAAVVVFFLSLRGTPQPVKSRNVPAQPVYAAEETLPGAHGVDPAAPDSFSTPANDEPLVFTPLIPRVPDSTPTNLVSDDYEVFLQQQKAQMQYLRELSRQNEGDESSPTLTEEGIRDLEAKHLMVH